MQNNGAVSAVLLETLVELQALPSLASFGVAGGTSLAIRYGHRKSIDIDLFSPVLLGVDGMKKLGKEIEYFFGKERVLFLQLINDEYGDQYCFVRALVKKEDIHIKVEMMQNVPLLDEVEVVNNIRMVSIKDIGLLKLKSLCSRQAKKDAYDLDLITEDAYSLEDLMSLYEEKGNKFNQPEHKWVFDLDESPNPLILPEALLAFDEKDYKVNVSGPHHSDDLLDIAEGAKSFIVARSSWRRKVRTYMRNRGMEMPGVEPIN
jgi:hypothetical protein